MALRGLRSGLGGWLIAIAGGEYGFAAPPGDCVANEDGVLRRETAAPDAAVGRDGTAVGAAVQVAVVLRAWVCIVVGALGVVAAQERP